MKAIMNLILCHSKLWKTKLWKTMALKTRILLMKLIFKKLENWWLIMTMFHLFKTVFSDKMSEEVHVHQMVINKCFKDTTSVERILCTIDGACLNLWDNGSNWARTTLGKYIIHTLLPMVSFLLFSFKFFIDLGVRDMKVEQRLKPF